MQKFREKRGLSQRDLSQRIGISSSLIDRIEDGSFSRLSVLAAKRIAEALQVSLDYLAGMYDQSERDPSARR